MVLSILTAQLVSGADNSNDNAGMNGNVNFNGSANSGYYNGNNLEMERDEIMYVGKTLVWAGIVLMVITALIHFVDAPDAFGEVTYKGLLFVANNAGALIAAVGIWRGARGWGWGLGLVVAAGAITGYAISRTFGMPGLGVDPWMEPLGVASLIVEGLFTLIALKVLLSRSQA